MIYGHGAVRANQIDPSTDDRDAASGWKRLDAQRRLAMVEYALGNRRMAA